MKTVKLTPALLRRIVLEEKRKIEKRMLRESSESASLSDLGFLDSPEEVDADEFSDTLEAYEDQTVSESSRKRYNKLTLEERMLLKKLNKIRESKRNIRSRARR